MDSGIRILEEKFYFINDRSFILPSMNQSNILGNLVKDPYIGEGKSQKPMVAFTVALNRKFYTKAGVQKEERTYIDVTAWDRVAETAANLKKGQLVLVEGRLVNKQRVIEGKKVMTLTIHARRIQHFKTIRELKEYQDHDLDRD